MYRMAHGSWESFIKSKYTFSDAALNNWIQR